jgi:hypothetical protein
MQVSIDIAEQIFKENEDVFEWWEDYGTFASSTAQS